MILFIMLPHLKRKNKNANHGKKIFLFCGGPLDFSGISCYYIAVRQSKEKVEAMKCKKLALGLDIGTTNLCAAVVNIQTGETVQTITRGNKGFLPGKTYEKLQDSRWILAEAKRMAVELTAAHPISAIGVTGQMHGIVYLDAMGGLLSPLYTWQDERAGQACAPGKTYCQEIFEKTGQHIFPGYGWATHYYQMKNGLVPDGAAAICTIMDALTMTLAGNHRPVLHPSNAASLGLYDGKPGMFYGAALEKLGLDIAIAPGIMKDEAPVGDFGGIPVCSAIGDNQASVFGALADEEKGVLVNFGTGSQVSLITGNYAEVAGLETRPYLFGKYLLSGAALCGGKAYALAERFFRQYANALGLEGEQYALMQQLAKAAYQEGASLRVNTAFCGTRSDPALRGSVMGIGEDNFTPGHMILGVLKGMTEELFSMYEKMPREGRSMLAASGNGIRKNGLLQRVLKERFQMPLLLPLHQEEAAFGAALYAAVVSGAVSFGDAKACIVYAKG